MDQRAANITAVLTEFTYLDIQLPKFQNLTLKEIVQEIKESYMDRLSPGVKETIWNLEKAMQDPELGDYLANMKLVSQSHTERERLNLSGEGNAYPDERACMNDLIEACAFQGEDGDLYVAYRGTGDGKWPDNGEGFIDRNTDMQEAARRYFDYVYETTPSKGKVYVGGHSKGGNEAQYVLMTSEHWKDIEGCYSLDGQGFSKAAISWFQSMEGYEERLEKLYSINGSQDPVHDLITPIALEKNVYYVDCGPLTLATIANVHAMEGFMDGARLHWMEENDGHGAEGLLSIVARQIDAVLMEDIDEHTSRHVAIGVMGLVEFFTGGAYSTGLDGVEPTSIDYLLTLLVGVPAVLAVLISTPEGRELGALILRELPDLLCSKLLPGYDTLKKRFSLVLLERGIHNSGELWAYIRENPLENTLDIAASFLGNPETLLALAQLGISLVVWKAIILVVGALLHFLAPVITAVVAVLVVLIIVKIAADFLREHWEELKSLAGQAVEYVRERIAEMVSAIRMAVQAAALGLIATVFYQAKQLAEAIGTATEVLLESLRVVERLIAKALDQAFKLFNPLLYTIVRAVAGASQEPVTIDMVRLSHAVDQMDRLSTRVGRIDQRLDSLYGKLCVKSIEQGEGIFTSIANLYHLSSADVRVDQGHAIRRKANALRELFDGYKDCERWLAEEIGG